MRLYVVRHGETEENVSGIIQGHDPGTLTSLGIEQAERLALRLRDVTFDAIYTSDLKRASDTARHISAFHSLPVFETALLRERGAGIFQGRPKEELWAAEQGGGVPIVDWVPPGGESFSDLHSRACSFLAKLNQIYSHETILLVSHGGWNKMLLGVALNKSIEEALATTQRNACVNVVDYENNSSFQVHLTNCSTHL